MSRTATCGHPRCGKTLYQVAAADSQEWIWVDADNSVMHSRYPGNPYEELNRLAAVPVPGKKSDDRARARYAKAMETYSRLKVDLEMGGWYQLHLPVDLSAETYPDRPDDHCSEPPYLSPSGWQCRKCKTPLEARQHV